MSNIIKWVNIKNIKDLRGDLLVFESDKDIPFQIKRTYVLLNSTASRGFHAHKKLKQVIVCLAGTCHVILDNGTERQNIIFDSYAKGLLIDSAVWREMHNFSKDCVLLVFSDEYYDENDYIRDYDTFCKVVKSGEDS